MSTLLRRELAPVPDAAWVEIDRQAREVLSSQLSARRLVDFDGPHGWEFAAVNLGRLELGKEESDDGVAWGLRTVLPLIEVRVPFRLNQLELDEVTRGAKDPELKPLEEAARKVAHFEERAIYQGFAVGGVKGMADASVHKPVALGDDASDYPMAVAMAVGMLRATGVNGPYTLVLGLDRFEKLMQSTQTGYPLQKVIRNVLEGDIYWSPALEGGIVLSRRGGDFQLTVGEDLAIGYATHDQHEVGLYLTESFTFRVLEPQAAVALK